MRPGPALSCAASPVSTKMPAPMMAPTPREVSATGPRTRRSRCSPASSASSTSTGLTAKSWLRGLIATPPPPSFDSRVTGLAPACNAKRALDVCGVAGLEEAGQLARPPVRDRSPVEPHDRHDLDRRGGEEELGRAAQARHRNRLLADRRALAPGQR